MPTHRQGAEPNLHQLMMRGGRAVPQGYLGYPNWNKSKTYRKSKTISFLYTPLLEEKMTLVKKERVAITTGAGLHFMLKAAKTKKLEMF